MQVRNFKNVGMAAEPGFEPGQKDSKSFVLPLHNSASPILLYNFRDTLTIGAEGRTRTDTRVTPQQFLRLPRLPFRHFGRYEVVHRCVANGAEAQT